MYIHRRRRMLTWSFNVGQHCMSIVARSPFSSVTNHGLHDSQKPGRLTARARIVKSIRYTRSHSTKPARYRTPCSAVLWSPTIFNLSNSIKADLVLAIRPHQSPKESADTTVNNQDTVVRPNPFSTKRPKLQKRWFYD